MKFMLRVEIADVSAELGSARVHPARFPSGRTCWSGRTRGRTSAPAATPTPSWRRSTTPGLERPWFEYLVPAAELEADGG